MTGVDVRLNRLIVEVEQYGFSCSYLLNRLLSRSQSKVLANSVPKAGTNLLLRSLYLMPQLRRKLMRTISDLNAEAIKVKLNKIRPGEIAAAHIKYNPNLALFLQQSGFKHLLIVRDPRDISVSNYIYMTYKDTGHRLHEYFLKNLDNDSDRLMASICGVDGKNLPGGLRSKSLAEHLNDYMAWHNDSNCLFVSFENLIGSRGGGNDSAQLIELEKMRDYLDLDINNKKLSEIGKSLFATGSRTFVKGQIGTWREHFSDVHKNIFKEQLGDVLIQLGYEKNQDW